MLQLFTENGKELDLSGNDTVDIVLESDIFEFETIKGSYTIPLTLPLSSTNSTAYNYPSKNDVSDRNIRQLNVIMKYRGIDFFSGTSVAEKTNKTIDIQIYLTNGDFYFKTQNKKLKNINLGGEKTFVYTDGGYDPEIDHFQLAPIYAKNFYKDTPYEDEFLKYVIINRVGLTEQGKYNHYVTLDEDPDYKKKQYAIIPFPYLWYVIEQVFIYAGFKVTSNCFKTDSDLYKIVIFNNYNIVEAEFENPSFIQKVDKYNLINHIPDISIHDFILAIKKKFACSFIFNNSEVSIILNEANVFNNNKIINLTSKIDNSYNEVILSKSIDNIAIGCNEDQTDAQNKQVSIYNYLISSGSEGIGDVTFNINIGDLGFQYFNIEKFWKGIIKVDGTSITYDYEFFSSLLEQYYWSKFEEITKIVYPDTSLSFNFLLWNKYVPINNYEIISEASTINYTETPPILNPFVYNMPVIDLQGNHWFNRDQNSQQKLRLLLFHGAIGEQDIPWCNNDFYGLTKSMPNGNIATLRLRYNSELQTNDFSVYNGLDPLTDNCTLTKRFFKSFINWKLKQSATYYKKAKLSIYEIKNFDFTAKYLIDNTLYYCVSVKAKLTNEGVKECSLTLIPA